MLKKSIFYLIGVVFGCSVMHAQDVSIKNNILYDAALTPNLSAEVGTGVKTSLDLLFAYSPFNYSGNKTWKHILVQPGFRYWLCDRSNGSFVGVHAHWAAFNEGGIDMPFGIWNSLKDHRYQGQLWGGGISYGYQWPLSRHWAMEAEIGLGYAYIHYKKYKCETCGDQLEKTHTNYVGPTKAIFNIIYHF